jgi:hypothetical protein
VINYSVTLDVPKELVGFVAKLLRTERRARGTRRNTRRLTCEKQAIFGLAWFRDKPDVERLGKGFGLSRATSYRYVQEVIDALARRAPDLHQALERAREHRLPHLILDGTVIGTDRVAAKTVGKKGKEIDLWYSGKTGDFGGNIQAIFAPDGFPLWFSDVLPGNTHDLTAARRQVLAIVRPYLKDMPVLADCGYDGAGCGVLVPVKKPKDGSDLSVDNRTYNALLRAVRALGERGFALVSQRWKTLQHVTMSPSKIGDLARAALLLTHFEYRKIT